MALSPEFFTPEALSQLGVAIAAVTAVSVAVRRVSGISSPLIPFVASALITYIAAGAAGTLKSVPFAAFPESEFFSLLSGWLLPLLNTCLLFSSVVGVTEIGGALEGRKNQKLPGDPIRELSLDGRQRETEIDPEKIRDIKLLNRLPKSAGSDNRLFRSWF
jgi:hypothetical protein